MKNNNRKSNEINQSNSLWNGDITKLLFFEEENQRNFHLQL